MNAVPSPRLLLFWLMLAFLGLVCVPASAWAGSDATPILQANFLLEIFSDRTRMIQISLVVVAFGCAMMWWYR